jgi:hypothetical protein
MVEKNDPHNFAVRLKYKGLSTERKSQSADERKPDNGAGFLFVELSF